MGATGRIIGRFFDWGFANFSIYRAEGASAGEIPVTGSAKDVVPAEYTEFEALLPSSSRGKIEQKIELSENIAAPVETGDVVGRVVYSVDGSPVGEIPIKAAANAPRITFGELFVRVIAAMFLR